MCACVCVCVCVCNRKLIKFVHYRRAIALVWRKWKRLTILILCTRLLELVILITLVALFLPWHASLILKRNFYVTGNSYLGMVKMEAFDDSHFMHQAVRVGHTDHTGSIVSLMACIFDLKKKFLCNWKLVALVW